MWYLNTFGYYKSYKIVKLKVIWRYEMSVSLSKFLPSGGVGGEEDKLSGLAGMLSVCSATAPSKDANPNDIGPVCKQHY